MPQSFTEADAQAYAKRVGVRIETARSVMKVESESRDSAAAGRTAACAAAAEQIVRLHAVANGVKPKAVASKPSPPITSKRGPADDPAGTVRLRKVSDTLAAKASDTSRHEAAAAGIVALFNKVNPSQEAS